MTKIDAQRGMMVDYVAAWDALDGEAAASFFAPDGVAESIGAPEARGREAIGGMLTAAFGGADDGRAWFHRVFHHGNVMIGEWVWAGTHTGDLFGIPPSKKAFGIPGVSVYTFTDEPKLERARAYLDGGIMAWQLGVSPQPARGVQPLPPTNDSATHIVAAGSAAEEENVARARKWIAALEEGDADAFAALLSDDVVWDDVAQVEPMQGKDAAVGRLQAMHTAFPDGKAESDFKGIGDFVVIESVWTATHSGPLGPIPATHKPVEIHSCDILQLTGEGAIKSVNSYGNSMELMTQLGLVPAPEA